MTPENSEVQGNEEELVRQEIAFARKRAIDECAKKQRLDFYRAHNVLFLMVDSLDFPGEKEHVLFANLIPKLHPHEIDETVRKINLDVTVEDLSPISIKLALNRFIPRVFPHAIHYPIEVHETTHLISVTNPDLAYSN